MKNKEDSRYPYTYACDLIRMLAGYNSAGTKLSRADASHIRSKIAEIIGIPDEELANKLADYMLENEDAIVDGALEEWKSICQVASS
jgi:hypothetical protein